MGRLYWCPRLHDPAIDLKGEKMKGKRNLKSLRNNEAIYTWHVLAGNVCESGMSKDRWHILV